MCDILSAIDNVDVVSESAEIDVLMSLSNAYLKEFQMIQEAGLFDTVKEKTSAISNAVNEKMDAIEKKVAPITNEINAPVLGNTGESLLKKMLMFIPRLLAKIIRMLKRFTALTHGLKFRKEAAEIMKTLNGFNFNTRRAKKEAAAFMKAKGIEPDKDYDGFKILLTDTGVRLVFTNRITYWSGAVETKTLQDGGETDFINLEKWLDALKPHIMKLNTDLIQRKSSIAGLEKIGKLDRKNGYAPYFIEKHVIEPLDAVINAMVQMNNECTSDADALPLCSFTDPWSTDYGAADRKSISSAANDMAGELVELKDKITGLDLDKMNILFGKETDTYIEKLTKACNVIMLQLSLITAININLDRVAKKICELVNTHPVKDIYNDIKNA